MSAILQAKVAWAADGYVYDTSKKVSTYRSTPSVISADNVHFSIDNVSRTLNEYSLTSPSKSQRRRVKSATILRQKDKDRGLWETSSLISDDLISRSKGARSRSTPKRPHSAFFHYKKAWSASTSSRPGTSQSEYRLSRPGTSQSEYSQRQYDEKTLQTAQKQAQDLHKSFTMVSRWYQEWKFQSSINASPDSRFFDRHSRCFDHTHLHTKLLRERPQVACEDCRSQFVSGRHAVRTSGSQHGHTEAREEGPAANRSPEQIRYIQSMRPHTAPVTRREQQTLRHNGVNRGESPHFCSFVRKVSLHGRERSPAQSTPSQDYLPHPPPYYDDLDLDDLAKDSQWQEETGVQKDDGYEPEVENYLPQPEHPREEDISSNFDSVGSPSESEERKLETIRIPSPQTQYDQEPEPPDHPDNAWPHQEEEVTKGQTALNKSDPQANSENTKSNSKKCHSHKPPIKEEKKKRTSLVKKERKPPSERKKPEKKMASPSAPEVEEPKDESSQKTPTPPPTSESPGQEKSGGRVPNLPFVPPKEGSSQWGGSSKHSLLTSSSSKKEGKSSSVVFKGNLNEISGEEMKNNEVGYQFNLPDQSAETEAPQPKSKSKVQPWMHGRLALSQQSCRFELPMDMRDLETMSAQDYLRKHCVIASRRLILYQRIFLRHKDKTGHLSTRDLEKSLKDVLINTISPEELNTIFSLVELDSDSKVDYKLFCGVSAMAERMLYPKFLAGLKALKRTEDTINLPDHQKEKIESADFSALKWKFHGLNVNPPVRKILEAL